MKKLYIETYGCQMNVADSEVVASVMGVAGYEPTDTIENADAVFLNTCSVRDNAEQKIIHRLEQLNALRNGKGRKYQGTFIIGVLGCMAERVREELVEKYGVDLVAGPDAYLSLPDLILQVEAGQKAVNVELSMTETYRGVVPSRIGGNRLSGYISIMRGCNNFCHYCIVPYTRGRERSRDVESILAEARDLRDKGYKELTLLGQNVNSYKAPLNPPRGGDSQSSEDKDKGCWEIAIARHKDKSHEAHLTSPKGGDSQSNEDNYSKIEEYRKTASPDMYLLLEEKAKQMRSFPTEAENAMWEMLRGKNLGAKFRRQHVIGDYIVDFVCLEKNLVIEIDGKYHDDTDQKEKDAKRTAFLNKAGFKILRYTNEEVIANSQEVLENISACLEGHQESPLLGGLRGALYFSDLLRLVAREVPEMRIRFTTSHPKDMSDETLRVIAEEPNVCRHIHLPVQSGSNAVLERMNRKYTREWYLERVAAIRRIIPDCGLSTDIFAGYCGETEEDHRMSLSLMEECQYDSAFMFKYSERPGTFAARHLKDDVPEEVKIRRLNELIALQNKLSAESNHRCEGKVFEILVEGRSKRSAEQLYGRTEQNKVVVFPRGNHHAGEFLRVRITGSTSATLLGEVVE